MIKYTDKQLEALRFIKSYIEDHGRPPTINEIAEPLKIKTVTAWEHVNALVKKKAISTRKHVARSITILDPSHRPDTSLKNKVARHVREDKDFRDFILELAHGIEEEFGNTSS